jgi:hypothetical protein
MKEENMKLMEVSKEFVEDALRERFLYWQRQGKVTDLDCLLFEAQMDLILDCGIACTASEFIDGFLFVSKKGVLDDYRNSSNMDLSDDDLLEELGSTLCTRLEDGKIVFATSF